jgi:hypothetical protein
LATGFPPRFHQYPWRTIDTRGTARVEHGPRRGTDTELGVERLIRIGRVEYDDLADTGVGDLIVPTHDRLQMNVADRAAGETPKLQMDEAAGIGNRDRFAGNTDQFTAVTRLPGPFAASVLMGRLLIRKEGGEVRDSTPVDKSTSRCGLEGHYTHCRDRT